MVNDDPDTITIKLPGLIRVLPVCQAIEELKKIQHEDVELHVYITSNIEILKTANERGGYLSIEEIDWLLNKQRMNKND